MRSTVCYVASYEPDYPRNVDTVRAIESAGVRVEWVRGGSERQSPRRHSLLGTLAAGMNHLAGSIFRCAELPFRLLRCRALVIGYFGQVDMILLTPLARIFHRPVIFNPLVTLTDTVIDDRRIVGGKTIAAQVIRRVDRWSLALADVVIVDTPDNADFVAGMAGLSPDRVVVLPVGVDESIFYPARSKQPSEKSNVDVLFFGKFIPLHGVDTIIRAASLLQSGDGRIRFELIGTGQEYRAARELAHELGLSNIVWTDWLPYSELGERLRSSDVALGVFDGGKKAARVIPNKVHQALACRVPVVTRDSPAIRRMLADRESAILVPPDDSGALAAAISALATDDELRQSIASGGRAAWEDAASEDRLSVIMGEILDRFDMPR